MSAPSWKKVIVSGSSAELLNVTASNAILVGTNQQITTSPSTTFLSGSFSGSFYGPLTGTASYATSALTASYVLGQSATASYALTASYVLNAISSSYASIATTASYALTSTSASYALTSTSASHANQADNATSASNVPGSGVSGNISGNAYNITQYTIDQNLSQASNVTFNNAIVNGNLTVAGTASFTNTDNLTIRDKFILINSGSNALADSGWITQYNAAGSGSAFYLEATGTGNYGRFAVAYDAIGTSTALTPDEYVVTAKVQQSPGVPPPSNWGSSFTSQGNMWLTTAGDIYIYS
jgi:hypothetical protein